jgi:predicted  nucleic acid-binding Zn-ribbon protein
MSYRGGDLDLRTPQSRSGSERGTFEPPLNGPRDFDDAGDVRSAIWVDDTLMACCNHAYDVAMAHRSGDVRIEHLLYALTRIDDAAEVLESHGVRDASLRREAGLYIASEIPIAPTNGQATPRRSPPLEQALRQAAHYAYSRNRAASVSDLLHVFSEIKPDLPGLQLLHRNMPGLISDHGGKQPIYQPLPDSAFMGVAPAEPARRPVRPAYYDDFAATESNHYRQGLMQNHTDMVQNSRLGALEKMVMALREDTGRFTEDLTGRFVSLENSFSGGRGSDSRVLQQTADKLAGIELSLTAKLEDLARQASRLAGRLETLETRLESAYTSGGIDLSPLSARLDKLEAMIREDRAAGDAMVALVGDRVSGEVDQKLRHVEGVMRERAGGIIDLAPIENRLNDIESALLGSGDGHQTVEVVTARVEAAEHAIASRLTGLQQAQATDRDQVLEQQATDIRRAENALQERVSAVARLIQDTHVERVEQAKKLDVVETMLMQQGQSAAEGRETSVQELGEVHEAIVKLNANQHTLAGAIDQWRSESVSDMNAISVRLAQIDQDSELPLQHLEQISERMDGMYRATVERYHRRNRFWYWLFGTDDWIGASWQSQGAIVDRDLQAVGGDRPSV